MFSASVKPAHDSLMNSNSSAGISTMCVGSASPIQHGPRTVSATERAAAARFIADVCAKNHAFYSNDLGQGALKGLQQTFPHTWLYVGELLQNAVDAGAKQIRFAITD